MKSAKQFLSALFPLPPHIIEIIQAQAFLLISPNKNGSTTQNPNKTILRCLQCQTEQQAKEKQVKFTSLSNAFHLSIIQSQTKHLPLKDVWGLFIEMQSPQCSLKQKLNMNRNSRNNFTQNQLILIVNCMNSLFSSYITGQPVHPIKSTQLLDCIFFTSSQMIKLAVPSLMAPLKARNRSEPFKKEANIEDCFAFCLFFFEIITLIDKRDIMNLNLLVEKVSILEFRTFCMRQLKSFLLQKLAQFIEQKALEENPCQILTNESKKFPSIHFIKSSRINRSQKPFESPSQKKSHQNFIGQISQNSFQTNNKFRTLNQMAHDKIVQSFQQDEYSYILESNNSSPSRISPHKGFPALGLLNFSQEQSLSIFSPQLSQKIPDSQSISFMIETQHYQMRSSLQNSKNSGMQNSNLNSIILQVEEESNYEIVEGSSVRSDIIDLSFSQNNEQIAQLREIQDPQNRTKYFGEVVKGVKQGKGKMFYCDGGYYEGEWKQNQIFGFGRLFYPSNKLAYAGYWKFGCFHGPGLVLNQQIQAIQSFDYTDFSNLGRFWISYRGNFNMDVREGLGVVKISNGDMIAGNWEGNLLNGQAQYRRQNGSIVKGIWKMNKLQKILYQQIKS